MAVSHSEIQEWELRSRKRRAVHFKKQRKLRLKCQQGRQANASTTPHYSKQLKSSKGKQTSAAEEAISGELLSFGSAGARPAHSLRPRQASSFVRRGAFTLPLSERFYSSLSCHVMSTRAPGHCRGVGCIASRGPRGRLYCYLTSSFFAQAASCGVFDRTSP